VLGQTNQAAGFDCASLSEITLALNSTQSAATTTSIRKGRSNLIVYANPQRAEQDLEESLQLGIKAFTFDGEEELWKIHRAYEKLKSSRAASKVNTSSKPSLPPHAILRLLVPDEHSTVPLGEKFGAVPGRIPTLTQYAMQLSLPLIGVSFHCGSGCHDPQAYAHAIRLAYNAMQLINTTKQEYKQQNQQQQEQQQQQNQQYDLQPEKCWLLDIGGGFPGYDGWTDVGVDTERFSANPSTCANATPLLTEERDSSRDPVEDSSSLETAYNVAQAINPLLDELFPPSSSSVEIIAEPGRYFVEAAFCLCSRIYRVQKDTSSSNNSNIVHYTIAQGVQGLFKDVLLCGESFQPIPLKLHHHHESTTLTLRPSWIHGPSGEDYDVICKTNLPELQVGDWLLFDRMGAYTLSISARSEIALNTL
jgi:ornithine decarboxylase